MCRIRKYRLRPPFFFLRGGNYQSFSLRSINSSFLSNSMDSENSELRVISHNQILNIFLTAYFYILNTYITKILILKMKKKCFVWNNRSYRLRPPFFFLRGGNSLSSSLRSINSSFLSHSMDSENSGLRALSQYKILNIFYFIRHIFLFLIMKKKCCYF